MARSWSGAAQSGSPDYEDADVERVLELLPRGRGEAMTYQTFAGMLGMEARKVRAILSDNDGVHYALAINGDLFYAAEHEEETRSHTEKLRARAQSEMKRVARRERFAKTVLTRLQPEMAL